MNKVLLLTLVVVAMIAVVHSKEIRQKLTMENMCREQACTFKCQGNGYTEGACRTGDMTEFCVCGLCEATKCSISCDRDNLKGSCEVGYDGRCVCE